jgi:hypothetical protein
LDDKFDCPPESVRTKFPPGEVENNLVCWVALDRVYESGWPEHHALTEREQFGLDIEFGNKRAGPKYQGAGDDAFSGY